jgi:hypothetical protein
MSKPIKPDEVGNYKTKVFPAYVFDAFNEAIAAKFCNGYASVKQKDVVALILAKANKDLDYTEENGPLGVTSAQIYANEWLNVEEAYRDAGWKVTYDKPAYNEFHDAYFEFRKGK